MQHFIFAIDLFGGVLGLICFGLICYLAFKYWQEEL